MSVDRRELREAIAHRFRLAGASPFRKALELAVASAMGSGPLPPSVRERLLAKRPCTLELLPVAVQRKTRVTSFIDSVEGVPALSPAFQKVANLMGNDKTTIGELAAAIEEDQGITVRVLRLAKAATRYRSTQITSVEQAIGQIGFMAVQATALSTSVVSALRGHGTARSLELWRHAYAVGSACRAIARRLRLPNSEECFVLGLVHDMGQLVLLQEESFGYDALLNVAAQPDKDLIAVEQAELGITHEEVGYMLGRRWRLPDAMISVLRHHHDPARADRRDQLYCLMVALGDVVSTAMGFGSDGLDHVAAETHGVERLVDSEDLSAICLETFGEFYAFEEFYNPAR